MSNTLQLLNTDSFTHQINVIDLLNKERIRYIQIHLAMNGRAILHAENYHICGV